jgi:hypothetical protein
MSEDGDRMFVKMTIDLSNQTFCRRTQDKVEETTTNQQNNTTKDRNLKAPIKERWRG